MEKVEIDFINFGLLNNEEDMFNLVDWFLEWIVSREKLLRLFSWLNEIWKHELNSGNLKTKGRDVIG